MKKKYNYIDFVCLKRLNSIESIFQTDISILMSREFGQIYAKFSAEIDENVCKSYNF